MKIGILTYHRVVNDGSIMQAYCGQKVLSSLFPNAKVEIIDYIPTKLWWTEHKKIIGKRPPFVRFSTIKKMKSVNRFIQNHLVLSPQSSRTDDVNKAVRFIHDQRYDVVFVGSDTVWEARFSRYVPHPPNAYYLPGQITAKKISYAASSDPTHPEFTGDKPLLDTIVKHIKGFDHITVRDKTTEEYLKNLGIPAEEIHFMPDPTLQCYFDELVQKPEIKKQRPWAAIGFGGVKKAVVPQLDKQGFDIVDLADFTLNGKTIPGAAQSVNVRLGVFSMLDFLITDRFHSSIFTLKLADAPVVFVEVNKKWPDPNSKGRDLFQRLGIEEMIWRYEGGDTPDCLIEKYLAIWKNLNISLPAKISDLRKISAKQLIIARKIITG